MPEQTTRPQWVIELRTMLVCLGALILAVSLRPFSPLSSIVLFVVSYAAGFVHPLREAWDDMRDFSLNVDFLMLVVAGGAAFLGHPEEGAMLLVLFGASRAMESWAHARTENAIRELMRDFPTETTRLENGEPAAFAVSEVRAGHLLMIRNGETFPVDCQVEEGTGAADTSAINGESEPLMLKAGAEVPSGAVNGTGVVTVRALRPASESAYQKIMLLVASAPERHSHAQVISDRAGKWFTWAILSASVIGFLAWRFAADLTFGESMYRAMALLVAGSPCALVLSIPSAVMAAISAGARRGVLFNGGRGLYAAADIHTVMFDKTGTLTTGVPHVEETSGEAKDDEELLGIALALARSSHHPASKAVVAKLKGAAKGATDLGSVHEIAGQGLMTEWEGHQYLLGRDPQPEDRKGGVVVLSMEGRTLIRFHLSETLRPDVLAVTTELRSRGSRSVILSGDRQSAVERIRELSGVDEAIGDLKPEDKHRLVVEAGEKREGVMMVGDGINDVPALAAAECGVAMGMRGTSAALAQADIVLARDRLTDLPGAMDLARRTRRIIVQNMTIAIGAAAVLVSFAVAGSLPLLFGVFGHEGGTVLVVLNSLRLLMNGNNEMGCGDVQACQAGSTVTP